MESREADRRRIRLDLVLVSTVVLSLAGLALLGSERGRLLFVDSGSVKSLLEGVDSGGGVVLEGSRRESTVLELSSVELDSKSRYLLVAELGAGDRVLFVGKERGAVTRLRCPPRPRPSQCHHILDSSDLPAALRFHVAYEGRSHLALERVAIGRLSPLHHGLRPVLQALLWLAAVVWLWHRRDRLIRGLRSPRPIDDIVFALLLFISCLAAFHAAPVRQVVDSRYLTAVSHSIIHGDGIVLPDYFREAHEKLRYQLDRVDGKLLHHYSPVPAILDAPVVAAYEMVGVTPAIPGVGWNRGQEVRILRFSAAWVSALLCVVLYAMARGFLTPLPSLALTLVFAAGTQILSTLSRPYWAHTWAALLAALALLLVVRPLRGRETLSAALSATLISVAFYCRPQVAWTVVGLVAILAATRSWRRLATLVGVGLFWAVLGMAVSLSIYDSILPSYFFSSQVARGRLDAESLNSYRYVTSTLGALVSPGRGLFVYSPIYLWILYQIFRGWRSLTSRTWAVVGLGVITGHLWLLVHTGVWPGGHSFGARQFSDVLVWFFLLAVLAVAALEERWTTLTPTIRRTQIASLVLLVLLSVFVNVRGAWSKETWAWRSYDRPPRWKIEGREPPMPQPQHWNWRHPQFLAGLLPPDRRPPVAVDRSEE